MEKDHNGQDYNVHGGQYELDKAIANGHYHATVAIQNNMPNPHNNYVSPYPNHSGGGNSTPYTYKMEKRILYLIFIFVPKFIFYYLLFKNFGKTFLLLIMAGIAYIGYSDFGRTKINEYERTLTPKNIQFNNIDVYGLDAKLVKKYRALDANGLSQVHIMFDELPVVAQSAFQGVIREKILQNPNYFKVLENSSDSEKRRFSNFTCWYAKSFTNNREYPQYQPMPKYEQIALERGYLQFYEACDNYMPATRYYNSIRGLPGYPPIKAELDRLNSNPLFFFTKNIKNFKEWSAIIGGLMFLIVLMISLKEDNRVKEEKEATKLKLEVW